MTGVSFNMATFMNDSMNAVNQKGNSVQEAMKDIYIIDEQGNKTEEIDPGKLVDVQFQIGQYNTMIESISSVAKSITDSMKSIAQRAS